eukprot:TRINITY_DN881_c0_g1_i1.p1 TRINITY_DN881_c0_g1~~TRINITY_DN881_c0_g1_i1.p1  ORF type:complete len:452 (+),score=89.09 TRINITY_DN881_c0_g1_i1:171-1358(+)
MPPSGSTIVAGPTSFFRMNATWSIMFAARDSRDPGCPEGETPAARNRDNMGAHQRVLMTHCTRPLPPGAVLEPHRSAKAQRLLESKAPTLGVCFHRVELMSDPAVAWMHSWVNYHRAEFRRGELALRHITLYTMAGRRPHFDFPHLWVTVPWVLERLKEREWVTNSRPYQKWSYWDCLFRYRTSNTVSHVAFADPDEVFYLRVPLRLALRAVSTIGFREVMYTGRLCQGSKRSPFTARYGFSQDNRDVFRGKYIVSVQPPVDYWGLKPLRDLESVPPPRFCSLDVHWSSPWPPQFWQHGKKEIRRKYVKCQRTVLLRTQQGWLAHVRGALSDSGNCTSMPATCQAVTGTMLRPEVEKSGMVMQRAEIGGECVPKSDPRAAWFWGGPEGARTNRSL